MRDSPSSSAARSSRTTRFGITVTEVFGVLFAGLVLVITFGSLLAAGMPLLSALLGVGIVVGGIIAVAGVHDGLELGARCSR